MRSLESRICKLEARRPPEIESITWIIRGVTAGHLDREPNYFECQVNGRDPIKSHWGETLEEFQERVSLLPSVEFVRILARYIEDENQDREFLQ